MYKILFCIFGLFYLYAIVRYQLGKEMWEGMDYLYAINKAIAWTGGTCIALTLLPENSLQHWTSSRKQWGIVGYSFAAIHILFSFILLSPTYFPSFYDRQILSPDGWINVLLGIISFFCFSLAFLASLGALKKYYLKCAKWGLLLNLLHVVNIGVLKWWPMDNWVLYLPPITLLYTLELAVVFLVRKRNLAKANTN